VTFPPDPNAPGGPRRSEFLRERLGSPGRSVSDRSPGPDIAVRVSAADDGRESLRRLASLNIRDGHTVAHPFRSNAAFA